MINEQLNYFTLTSKIIGRPMQFPKTLGNGFQEVIYQRALAIEMLPNIFNFDSFD
jgi:hypothetical protein